ncbi:MAG: 30S ribosome-binding factor RbfA [Chloroflexi bacterium]|nr:30S ribosome-binding factor RbfA [Chloroflexota bacterium]
MSWRTLRINNLLREEISDLLQHQVRDPRLGHIVSITEVETSTDLRHARVFISVLGTEENKKEAMEGIATASNFLRRELARRLSLRRIPELTFSRDDSIERGTRLLKLIDEVSKDKHPEAR